MAEDLHVKRYFAPLRAGIQLVKTYVNISQRTNLSENGQARPTRGQHRMTREARRPRPSRITESVCLFPGWAVRHYLDNDLNKFDLHVHVSGYATSLCSPPTRSQMMFMRLAKSIASLNKFAETHYPKCAPISEPGSPKTSLGEENDLKELDESYSKLSVDANNSSSDDEELQSANEPTLAGASDILQRLQDNLESRVRLFWPSMLSSRAVRLELFTSQHHGDNSRDDGNGLRSVGRSEATTGPDGQFHHHFVIKWDDICHHPRVHYAPGEQLTELELTLHAKLLPSSIAALNAEDCEMKKQVITLSHAPIRVISDIDDTIKMSDILSGARTIFRNVFARDLEDAIIPGMAEWYTNMWNKGVRFHYVSNGPIQLLPLILNFLEVARLPPGSIRLKSYAPGSLFRNLLTAPADRKREGLVKILDSFEDSKFILIGDSGEQDLELYAQLASKYPAKILAIFIRDVEPDASPILDPTGKAWRSHVPSRNNTDSSYGTGGAPGMSRSNSVLGYKLPTSRFTGGRKNTSSPPSSSAPLPPTEEDQPPSIDVLSSPILFEREPTDGQLSKARPIKKSALSEPPEEPAWLSSSPHHLPQLSSSPLSVSVLDQAGDGLPGRQSSLLLTRVHSRPRGSRSDSTEASFADFAKADEDPIAVAHRRSGGIAFADEMMPISQSPEMASVFKSSMGTPRISPSRRRTQTVDELPPPPPASSSTRSRLRPHTPRRNTTSPSSLPGAGADTPLTSSSVLSLSRYRSISDAERKRDVLQDRVWRARSGVPEHVVLRIFRDPVECEEMKRIVK